MKRTKFPLSQKGFTLVELLIVIVIIGILAGVVIGVLNPIQQQNRARDAATRSAIDKVALSTKSLWSSATRTTNKIPSEQEFLTGISNVNSPVAADACTVTTTGTNGNCVFGITGIRLPTDCSAANGGYTGTGGTNACNYFYKTDYYTAGGNSYAEFLVAARGWANPVRLYVFSFRENLTAGNAEEGFYDCATTVDYATSGTTPIGTCTLIN